MLVTIRSRLRQRAARFHSPQIAQQFGDGDDD
jgi:hypothetical protein